MEAPAGTGRIEMKMNSLVDPTLIDVLYEASEAGVEIDLVSRGICCLRPGVPGLSGRDPGPVDRRSLPRTLPDLLLRQRRGAGIPALYIGSADLMPRNLDGRDRSTRSRRAAGAATAPPGDLGRQPVRRHARLAPRTRRRGGRHVERRNTVDTHRRLQELALARATRRPVVAALDSWAIGSAGG